MSFPLREAIVPSRGRGFALVDCIVATVLLGASLAVMTSLAGRALSSQAVGEHISTAAMLADEQLHLMVARGPDGYAQRFPTEGVCDAPFSDYKYKLALAGGGSVGEPYQVTCTVSWTVGGAEHVVNVETLIAARTGSQDSDPNPVRTPKQTVNRNP